jgi:glycosyltransferase involved in cell wall biosynthesis
MQNKNLIHKVFCVSRDGINAMKYLGFKDDKIVKIPLGIDNRIFFPYESEKTYRLRQKLGLRKVTIAYFGRIIPEKGLLDLLTALGKLKNYEWQLLIDNLQHTEVNYHSKLNQKIKELKLQERIVFFNAKHSEMPDYINCSDIVVLPSILTKKFKEQYGRVVAEAICCGKIVLVSNTGALPEVVGDVGFVFEGGNVQDMTDKLNYLLSNFIAIKESSHIEIAERGSSILSAWKQAEILYSNL